MERKLAGFYVPKFIYYRLFGRSRGGCKTGGHITITLWNGRSEQKASTSLPKELSLITISILAPLFLTPPWPVPSPVPSPAEKGVGLSKGFLPWLVKNSHYCQATQVALTGKDNIAPVLY